MSTETLTNERFKLLSGSTLKILAMILMLVDHIGASVFRLGLFQNPDITANAQLYNQLLSVYRVLRFLGRPAFPIFCFLLVEGFIHTRNPKKYALRLLLFALISEVPFDFAIYGTPFSLLSQNVGFTLLIGVLMMMLLAHFSSIPWLKLPIIAGAMGLAWVLRTDYSYMGIFSIAILYLLRYERSLQSIAGAISFSWENGAPLAFIPIWLYNGKKGVSMGYLFYLFYPVHLLILGLIAYMIGK